jgi:hypothetical protein
MLMAKILRGRNFKKEKMKTTATPFTILCKKNVCVSGRMYKFRKTTTTKLNVAIA